MPEAKLSLFKVTISQTLDKGTEVQPDASRNLQHLGGKTHVTADTAPREPVTQRAACRQRTVSLLLQGIPVDSWIAEPIFTSIWKAVKRARLRSSHAKPDARVSVRA